MRDDTGAGLFNRKTMPADLIASLRQVILYFTTQTTYLSWTTL
jgi:hypothetical protein